MKQRIVARFQQSGGNLIRHAVREHLGSDALYSLSPQYAQEKPKLKGFRRFAGKSPDQPLIFSGELYAAIAIVPDGDGFVVQVDDARGLSPEGFDYAEFWESVTDYLGKGLDDVEDQLDELLADIIVQEMLL